MEEKKMILQKYVEFKLFTQAWSRTAKQKFTNQNGGQESMIQIWILLPQ